MAVNLVVAIRTTGDAALRRLGVGTRQLATSTRFLGLEWTRVRERMDGVNDAVRGADGLWRHQDGRLVTTRAQVVRTTTAFGHLVNTLNGVGGGANGFSGWLGTLRSPLQAFSNFMQSLPPQVQAAAYGAGASLAVAMAAGLGAALSGALLLALGGGALAGAIALAARDKGVQNAFKGVFKPIADDATSFSHMLAAPLIESAAIFGRGWRAIADDVRDIFQMLSGAVTPLAEGITGLITHMMPGLKEGIAAAMPILREFAARLPDIGDAISSFFSQISSQGEGAMKGLNLLIILIEGSLVALGYVLAEASRGFNLMTTAAEAFVDSWAGAVLGMSQAPIATFLDDLKPKADASTGSMRTLEVGMSSAARASEDARVAIQGLSKQMHDLVTNQIDASEAARLSADAIRELATQVRAGADAANVHTERGSANIAMVNAAVSAFERERQAAIDLAGGQNAAASAVAAANGKFSQQVGDLEAVLRKAGLTEGQINSLLGAYRDMANAPNLNKQITVTTYYRVSGSGAVTSSNARPGRGSGVVFERFGGVRMARSGLMNLSGMAGLASPGAPMYGFAEHGTGGEAFVARNAPRARSLAIANTAARWHGGMVVPAGSGGRGGNTYNVNVTVPPMANPADAGRAAVEAIKSYEQTSGSGWRT